MGASVGFLCGSFVIIPIAEVLATFFCWAVMICVALWIIGAVIDG